MSSSYLSHFLFHLSDSKQCGQYCSGMVFVGSEFDILLYVLSELRSWVCVHFVASMGYYNECE